MNSSNESNESAPHFLLNDGDPQFDMFGNAEDPFIVAPVYGQPTGNENVSSGSFWGSYGAEEQSQSQTEYRNDEWDQVQQQRQPTSTLCAPYEEHKPDIFPGGLDGISISIPNFGMTNGQYPTSAIGASHGSDHPYTPHGSPFTATSPPTSSQGSWSTNTSPISARGRGGSLSRSNSQRHSPYHSPTLLRQRSLSASGGRPQMMGSMDGTDMASEASYSTNSLGLLAVPSLNTSYPYGGGRSAPASPASYSPSLSYSDSDGQFDPYYTASGPSSPIEPRQVGSEAITNATSNRRTREAKFFCPTMGCGRGFTARHNLKNHINSHNDVRNHPCQKCGNSFVTAHVKNRHEKTCKAQGQQSSS